MTILSLETSAAVASVALLRDGKVLAEAACDASKKHAETVLPAIDALLRGAGCAMAGLDAFAVDVGPARSPACASACAWQTASPSPWQSP